MASASYWTSGAPLMKLNTKQAMANDVNKNAGPILVSAIKRKVTTYQKLDYKEMLLFQIWILSLGVCQYITRRMWCGRIIGAPLPGCSLGINLKPEQKVVSYSMFQYFLLEPYIVADHCLRVKKHFPGLSMECSWNVAVSTSLLLPLH